MTRHMSRGRRIVTLAAVLAVGLATPALAVTSVPAPDTSFGSGGVAQAGGPASERFYDVVETGLGVYAVGSSMNDRRWNGMVARFTPTGQLDTTFSGDGVAWFSRGTWAVFDSVAVQRDGRLVISGSVDGTAVVVRMLPGGRLDPSFSADGVKPLPATGVSDWSFVRLDGNGRIVMATTQWPNPKRWPSDGGIWRLRANGSFDPTFGNNGYRKLDLAVADRVRGLTIDAAGRPVVLLTGYRPAVPGAPGMLVRLTVAGRLDTTFSGDGWLPLRIQQLGGIWPLAVEEIPSGALVVGAVGATNGRLGVIYVLPDGTPDPSFGVDGVSTAMSSQDIALYQGGKLTDSGYVFTGSVWPSGAENPQKLYLARFAPTGGFDPTFGSGGEYVANLRVGAENYYAVEVDATGRLLIAGRDKSSGLLVRYVINSL